MALDLQSRGVTRTLWDSSIGKKTIMAVTGLIMIAFLLLHMLGNLKIFFGPKDYNHYSEYLRTIGNPVLHNVWFLWILRAILTVSLVLHVVSAAQLARRARASRPVGYDHGQRLHARYAPMTMRYGGTFLLVFLIWHLLDLSAGTVNPNFREGNPYHNVTQDFQKWWMNLIYIVAMVLLGLHINHGFRSATETLGFGQNAARRRIIERTGTTLALVISLGFILVPAAVMGGLVR